MSIWAKVFSRIHWQNKPSTASPINARNLNASDYAIDVIDDRVIELNQRMNEIEPYISDLADAVETAHKWAQWTEGEHPSATDNSMYWARIAQDAAEMAIINLGDAGYVGFQINEYGHLILTKSSVLEYLDFDLDSQHKDLIVTVTDTSGV
jgi:hypothetical protein